MKGVKELLTHFVSEMLTMLMDVEGSSGIMKALGLSEGLGWQLEEEGSGQGLDGETNGVVNEASSVW